MILFSTNDDNDDDGDDDDDVCGQLRDAGAAGVCVSPIVYLAKTIFRSFGDHNDLLL